MPTYFVTGATGFIGRHLVERLLAREGDIHVLVRAGSTDKLDAIVTRTRKGGGEIVAYLKTGSAYYAPSAAIVEMVDAILKDKKKILPCAAYLEGEYGIRGLYVGVPVKLGRRGIEQIVEISLTPDENTALQRSASAVKELTDKLGI